MLGENRQFAFDFNPPHDFVQVVFGADGVVSDTKVVPDSSTSTVDPKIKNGIRMTR